MYNILICDDEKDIVSALKIYIEAEGYRAWTAYTGKQALEVVRKQEIHLVLLDIMMPEMDGISTMVKLRESTGNIPVILLTAKSEDTDKILGLNIGADDYVTKPFSPLELLARIRSVLRRYMQLGGGAERGKVIRIGGIELDDMGKSVSVDGEKIYLTPREYDILKLLMEHAGQVFSPKEIYRKIWGKIHSEQRTLLQYISDILEKSWKSILQNRVILKWCGGRDIKLKRSRTDGGMEKANLAENFDNIAVRRKYGVDAVERRSAFLHGNRGIL